MRFSRNFVLLLLAIFLCTTSIYAQWHDTGYGKWIVTHFKHSPFPYEDISDPAFMDSSVFIFIPAGYLKKDYFDLIIDHHGHGAIIDPKNDDKPSYPEKFRQDYQLFESRKNAILVLPQAARNKASGAAGRFSQFGGFEKFIRELTFFLKHNDCIKDNAELRQIHISSFSGGYQITAFDISQNSPELIGKIKSVALWDSFYGRENDYFDWVLNKQNIFYSTYTPSGGTVTLNRLLRDSVQTREAVVDSVYYPGQKSRHPFIQYTHRSHGNVANGEFTYAQYLQQLPLDDIDIQIPELLSAIPGPNGITVLWSGQDNSHLSGYQLYGSEDGENWELLADTDQLTTQENSYFHSTKSRYHYRLQAVSDLGTKQTAPFSLVAVPHENVSVLLVYAENRRLARDVRGFDPDSFLHTKTPDLIASTALSLERPFASCSNRSIRRGLISPEQFEYVIWLGGDENIRDKLIDHPEKIWIKKFLARGKNILISGIGVPADLASAITSFEDRIFGEKVLGISGIDSIKIPASTLWIETPFTRQKFRINLNFPVELAFKYSLLPVIMLDNQYTIGALYKFRVGDKAGKFPTSTVLTLGFSLALTDNYILKEYILDQFFTYADSGDVTPNPPRIDKQMHMKQNSIRTIWPIETEQFIATFYNRERLAADTIVFEQAPMVTKSDTNETRFLRLQARSGKLISRSSELIGSSRMKNSRGRVLIVNGYDRVTGENSFDYCIEHGTAFNQLGYDFDTASNEAVISGLVRLSDYEIVDWMVGEESTNSETFNQKEQDLIAAYVNAGGKIIISGSEIGWDLVEKATSAEDSLFFKQVLGAKYVSDNAGTSRFFITGHDLSNSDTLHFGETYKVNYPDVLAANEDEDVLLTYDTGQAAGIGKSHTNNGKTILVAFPLETIGPEESRVKVFEYFVTYLKKSLWVPKRLR